MFVHASLQIDLVLNKLMMDSGRRSGGWKVNPRKCGG